MKTAARKLITKAEPNELELITKAAVRVEEIATEQKKMAEKVDKHEDAIEKSGLLQRLQELEQVVAGKIQKGQLFDRTDTAPKINLAPLFEDPTFQRLQKNDKGIPGVQYQLDELCIKSLLNDTGETDTAHGNYPGLPSRIPGAHGFALRPLRLLDVLSFVPEDSNSFEYVRVTTSGVRSSTSVSADHGANCP